VDGGILMPAGPANLVVTVDSSSQHQTLAGFGAAVAYMSNFLSARNDNIYEVLFVDSGLDILRLGNWYQNQPATGNSPNGPFTDHNAALIVQKATAARGGTPPKILMSSWSPPSYLKSNGMTKPAWGVDAGGSGAGTLAQVNGAFAYVDFADWWVRALAAYAANGIVPDYVSIQNEPDFFNAGWETCYFAAVEGSVSKDGVTMAGYGQALAAVYNAIQASSLASKPMLVGPESAGIGSKSVQKYLATLDPSQLFAIAHHLYGPSDDDPAPNGWGKDMTGVATTAAPLAKPIFMTEYAPNLPSMLNTAWLMYNAVAVEGVSAYIYWDLIWDNNTKGALVNIAGVNPTSTYTIADTFYAFKHFARWTDPGWVRVDATTPTGSTVLATAFVSPDSSQLTVVLLNPADPATAVSDPIVAVNPGAFPFSAVTAYRSFGTSERTAVVPLADDGGIVLPSQSIVTLVFSR
jgi:glucuronoarabinoxylan endo-1,4-beta-xylanase